MRFLRPVLVAATLALALFSRDTRAQILFGTAARAENAIERFEFAAAHRELDNANLDDPELRFFAGKLAVYESECDRAIELLSSLGDSSEVRSVLAIAKGCARVMASSITETDEAAGVWIRFQDEHDRPLKGMIVETVLRAREVLTHDLEATWPRPTRVLVVRDQLSLAAVTGLPYESAQKTGTVAVAKWARVAMLSPRANVHGFVWRDTLAHELTHLAISRSTADQAPLWLQEGIAKTEETRWREKGPFDDRPSSDDIARDGIRKKMDLPLDHLGPSLAMLPNADIARVAYAEVTSFVQFLEREKPGILPKLLAALSDGKGFPEALAEITGRPFAELDKKWRAELAAGKSAATTAPTPPKADGREKARLAELLIARGHGQAALTELEKVQFPKDEPWIRSLHGEALHLVGKDVEAAERVGEPDGLRGPYAPWWSIRARVLPTGPLRDGAFVEALSNDPYDGPAACEGGGDPALCAAAKQFPVLP